MVLFGGEERYLSCTQHVIHPCSTYSNSPEKPPSHSNRRRNPPSEVRSGQNRIHTRHPASAWRSRCGSLPFLDDSFHRKSQNSALRQVLHQDPTISDHFPVPLHAVHVHLLLACSLHLNPQDFSGRKRKLRAVDLRRADQKFSATACRKDPKRVPNKYGYIIAHITKFVNQISLS